MKIIPLMPLGLECRIRQFEFISVQHASQHDSLLEVGDVASDASSGAGGKGYEIRTEFFSCVAQPALGEIFLGFGEDGGVAVGYKGGDGDGGVAGDEFAADDTAFWWCGSGETVRSGWENAQRFIQASAEIWQILDLFVRRDDLFFIENIIDFFCEFLEAGGMFEEPVHDICHCDCGGG